MDEIQKILKEGTDKNKIRQVFSFSKDDGYQLIQTKYDLFSRYFFPGLFESPDAEFHSEMIENIIKLYQGKLDIFVNIAFRGAAKDAKTKSFIVFAILCDRDHYRRYYRVLSADMGNAVQFTTDIYNALISPRVLALYPNTFTNVANFKKMTRMGNFDTSSGIKVEADTVNVDQRGKAQDIETYRPDFIIGNDFENRDTLWSAITTKKIGDRMEEARTGLQKGGVMLYLANYISEMGNVHRLVTEKLSDRKVVMITPIIKKGVPTWSRYTLEDIEVMKKNDEDFEGERLCLPSSAKDVFFDRSRLEAMPVLTPYKEISGFKMFRPFDPSCRYASGHDVAGGIGLDSSTTTIINFDVFPCEVVATYADNLIRPEVFGDEIVRQVEYYGGCLVAPEENNHGHATIVRLKQLNATIYMRERAQTSILMPSVKEYGWNTNAVTKNTMLQSLRTAIEKGHLLLNDPDLIAEAKSYTRANLMDREIDPRLTTRHFDRLISLAIAWAVRDFAFISAQAPKTTGQKETDEMMLWMKQSNVGQIGKDYSGM